MNKYEYDKIINIIDECTETVYVTTHYVKKYISDENISVLKERIKELLNNKR